MNNMTLKNYLLNIISPPRCVACNERISLNTKAIFCHKCGKDYFLNNRATCKVCGKPIYENRASACAVCNTEKIWYIKNISRYLYKGSIKTAIQNMKFKRRMWISYEFGRSLCKTIKEAYADISFDMILYVPMSSLREMTRGFNQSYEMAEIISEMLNIPMGKNIIFKKPGIKTQSGLNRKERITNIKNAFYIKNSHLLTDKTVLLIDDVFTTGSTVNECARILKKNGALAVYVATLSTVPFE